MRRLFFGVLLTTTASAVWASGAVSISREDADVEGPKVEAADTPGEQDVFAASTHSNTAEAGSPTVQHTAAFPTTTVTDPSGDEIDDEGMGGRALTSRVDAEPDERDAEDAVSADAQVAATALKRPASRLKVGRGGGPLPEDSEARARAEQIERDLGARRLSAVCGDYVEGGSGSDSRTHSEIFVDGEDTSAAAPEAPEVGRPPLVRNDADPALPVPASDASDAKSAASGASHANGFGIEDDA